MTPTTATPIERRRGRAAIAYFTQAVTSWAFGLRQAEIGIVVFDRAMAVADVAEHPTRRFFQFAHCRGYLESSVRRATTFLTTDWATPKFLIAIPQLGVFGIFFHHVIVLVVHHGAIPRAD